MKPPGFIARWARAILNRYEGAAWSPRRSYLQASIQGARFDASSSTRRELVRKARYFERNSALVNRLADLFESYTVGGGMAFQPQSSDEEWNAKAKQWWDDWSQLPDISSRSTLGTVQSLTARNWFVDGESFIHLTRGESGRPRIQLFEGHLIETPDRFREDKSVADGVRMDGNGRPVSYYIGTETEGGRVSNFQEVNADLIVHVWEPSRPNQVRGLPFLYPVVNQLHDLDDLQILEMKAAQQAGRIGIVTKNAAGEVDAEELLRSGGVVSSSSDPERAEFYRSTLGGDEVVLKNGDSIEQFRSDRPSIVTMEYWKHLHTQVCMGVGIPYVVAFPDSMQGTVYRGALDMAHAWFLCRHQVAASNWRRVYEYVMGWARFNVPELRDAPADWKRVRIHPPKAVNVDVGRNSNAMLAELAAGSTTYSEIYGAKGQDWREALTQRSVEQEFIETLGLKLQAGQVQTSAQVEQARAAMQPQEVAE